MTQLPWQDGVLKDWAIVGMNHYHIEGQKYLFVSMAKKGRCVTEEGLDNGGVWERLEAKVTAVNLDA